MRTDVSDIGPPPGFWRRVRNVLLAPQAEWSRIAAEDPAPLLKSYVIPLAALAAAAAVVAKLWAQGFSIGPSWSWLLVSAVIHVALAVLGVVLLSWFANFFAPRFGGERDGERSKRLAVYAATAVLAAGITALVPVVSLLLVIGGLIYTALLFGMGARPLMAIPEDRVPSYALSVLGATALVAVVAAITVSPQLQRGRAALASVTPSITAPAPAGTAPPQQQQRRSDVERLLAGMAVRNQRPAPIDPVRLQEQMPLTLPGGFSLESTSGSSPDGLSQAQGLYRAGEASLTLTIFHLGAIGDVAAAAAALDVAESEGGYVRRNSVDGRLFVESIEDNAVHYIVIGHGVAMRVDGSEGVTADRARAAVETIGVQRLERTLGI